MLLSFLGDNSVDKCLMLVPKDVLYSVAMKRMFQRSCRRISSVSCKSLAVANDAAGYLGFLRANIDAANSSVGK